MYQPIIDHMLAAPPPLVQPREPTGWGRVDRTLSTAHRSLSAAEHEEEFQAIGLMCREVLISLGQAVYEPTKHETTIDDVEIGNSDGARMIQAFFNYGATGRMPSCANMLGHRKTWLRNLSISVRPIEGLRRCVLKQPHRLPISFRSWRGAEAKSMRETAKQ
jgi:hypothetical protein